MSKFKAKEIEMPNPEPIDGKEQRPEWLDVEPETPTVSPTIAAEIEGARLTLQEYMATHAPKRPKIASLNEAAECLLNILEPRHKDIVANVALENGFPAWVIILGAVARAADARELHAGDFQPDWLNNPGQVQATPTVIHCEHCRLPIPGARRGQVACCNPHGVGKDYHDPGCAAAVQAGVDLAGGAPVEKDVAPEHEAPAVAPLAMGLCRQCRVQIVGGRPGQLFCCNRHGVGQDAHSDDCETAAHHKLGQPVEF